MNINGIKKVVSAIVKQKKTVTPMIWGPHGIGKTSAVKQVADELGYKMVTIMLSQKEAVDIAGMLYTYKDESSGMTVTGYNPPDWFAKAIHDGKVIIFMDEFNQGRRDVMSAAFELVLDRRLNNVKLPDSVVVIAAGNPNDERYDTNEMSKALIDRFVHLHAEVDQVVWFDWAVKSKTMTKEVMEFVGTMASEIFKPSNLDHEFPVDIDPSPRSWERVAMLQDLEIPKNLLGEVIRGCVGVDYAMAFMSMLERSERPLSKEDIFSFDADQSKRLADYLAEGRMRIDLVSMSVNNLVKAATETPEEVDRSIHSVIMFMEMLPDDIAVTAVKQLYPMSDFWTEKFLNSEILKSKVERVKSISKQ